MPTEFPDELHSRIIEHAKYHGHNLAIAEKHSENLAHAQRYPHMYNSDSIQYHQFEMTKAHERAQQHHDSVVSLSEKRHEDNESRLNGTRQALNAHHEAEKNELRQAAEALKAQHADAVSRLRSANLAHFNHDIALKGKQEEYDIAHKKLLHYNDIIQELHRILHVGANLHPFVANQAAAKYYKNFKDYELLNNGLKEMMHAPGKDFTYTDIYNIIKKYKQSELMQRDEISRLGAEIKEISAARDQYKKISEEHAKDTEKLKKRFDDTEMERYALEHKIIQYQEAQKQHLEKAKRRRWFSFQ